MLIKFDIEKMVRKELIPSPERGGKGWSYSFIYHLKDIKKIYLVCKSANRPLSVSELLAICKENKIESESKKEWTKRNLLEVINALKNFGLIDSSTSMCSAEDLFSYENTDLTEKDMDVFKNIYRSYFRFLDFHQIFQSTSNSPTIIYAFKEKQRFFNSFVCLEKQEFFHINETHQDTMRFWDVYTKWGETLGLLNKCSLASFGVEIDNPHFKNIYVCNQTTPMPREFSVCNYIQDKMPGTSYYIPDIEWKLIKEFGFSVQEIKKAILDECTAKNFTFRLQKASFLTVDHEALKLFPIIGNTYMSHILKIS